MKRIKQIMLIDDDAATNFLNRLVLEDCGCTEDILIYDSAKDALAHLKCQKDPEHCPQIILLDINMPDLNGWDFLEQYRYLADYMKQSIVIFMLTTSLNPDDSKKAEQIKELAGFLEKPLTHEKIERIIKEFH